MRVEGVKVGVAHGSEEVLFDEEMRGLFAAGGCGLHFCGKYGNLPCAVEILSRNPFMVRGVLRKESVH